MPQDSSGNEFYVVENIRVTAVPNTWDNGKPGLRIQAYKGNGDSLFPGAEIPIDSPETAYRLIKAITKGLEQIGL